MTNYGMPIWYELLTRDVTAAKTFYGDIAGWTTTSFPGLGGAPYEIWNANGAGIGGVVNPPEDGPRPMWPTGDYRFLDVGDTRIGAVMDRSAPEQPVKFTFYFAIPDDDVAVDKVKAGGGSVIMGPMDVPGGQRIILCVDPTGASVGFVSGERA